MNMATGGMPYSKKDSKQRSNWQRSTSYSDRDDAHSLNSVPNDVRINNWVCDICIFMLVVLRSSHKVPAACVFKMNMRMNSM